MRTKTPRHSVWQMGSSRWLRQVDLVCGDRRPRPPPPPPPFFSSNISTADSCYTNQPPVVSGVVILQAKSRTNCIARDSFYIELCCLIFQRVSIYYFIINKEASGYISGVPGQGFKYADEECSSKTQIDPGTESVPCGTV